MVLVLDPGMGCRVEQIEGQLADPLEHGDQPAFNIAPQALLLAVLIRRKRNYRLVQNAECVQAVFELLGHHGGAIVGQQGSRQAAAHQGLTEAMHQAPRRLVQEPLSVADQPRAVVEDA